jgi:4-diphosphocytidyl-2-C-methyl-D-erythritol kinase
MRISKLSPCKVNLLLNILGRRADGFHELETIMQPVPLCDQLDFERAGGDGIELTCSMDSLSCSPENLVYRAAMAFLAAAKITSGVKIHLVKRIPLAAGLGGGSGNAATALLGLNELFGQPLTLAQLQPLAAGLGSDVPFFLQTGPALATGRGEKVEALAPFPALKNKAILLIHPGFGIATAWAYKELARFPDALNGKPGRAAALRQKLQSSYLKAAATEFYNSLEAPALHKYPVLALYQEFLRERGAEAALMSGSGSTTFALTADPASGKALEEQFKSRFGSAAWTAVVPLA